MDDRDGALVAELEAGVRRDVITLRTVVRSNCRAVVLARVCASDVEPVSDNVDRFTEVDRHRRVVRSVEAIADGLGSRDPWSKLDNRRSATRIRRAGLEIIAVLICILRTVQLSEQRIRVARRRRARASFEATRTRTVTDEV